MLYRLSIALTLFSPALVFAITDDALNAGAKGAVVGAAMGIIGGIATLVWLGVRWVKDNALPKAKKLVETGADKAVEAAREFQSRNKTCPFCAETIKREAIVCKHCNRSL